MLSGLLLTLPGCSRGPRSNAADAADAAFAVGMVPHHEMGITLDEIAIAGADDVRVRRLAFEMNTYHGPELDQLRGWAHRWGGTDHAHPGPAQPTDEPMGMPSVADLDRLRSSRGPAFDQLFLTLMITHHEGAVTMADQEISTGSNRAAVAMARRIAEVQRTQLAAMRVTLADLPPV